MAKAEATVGGGRKVTAPKHKSGKHRLFRTTIEHADNGGHMVTHSFKQEGKMPYEGGTKPDESVAVTNNRALHKHMKTMFPIAAGGNAGTPGGEAEAPGGNSEDAEAED